MSTWFEVLFLDITLSGVSHEQKESKNWRHWLVLLPIYVTLQKIFRLDMKTFTSFTVSRNELFFPRKDFIFWGWKTDPVSNRLLEFDKSLLFKEHLDDHFHRGHTTEIYSVKIPEYMIILDETKKKKT